MCVCVSWLPLSLLSLVTDTTASSLRAISLSLSFFCSFLFLDLSFANTTERTRQLLDGLRREATSTDGWATISESNASNEREEKKHFFSSFQTIASDRPGPFDGTFLFFYSYCVSSSLSMFLQCLAVLNGYLVRAAMSVCVLSQLCSHAKRMKKEPECARLFSKQISSKEQELRDIRHPLGTERQQQQQH